MSRTIAASAKRKSTVLWLGPQSRPLQPQAPTRALLLFSTPPPRQSLPLLCFPVLPRLRFCGCPPPASNATTTPPCFANLRCPGRGLGEERRITRNTIPPAPVHDRRRGR